MPSNYMNAGPHIAPIFDVSGPAAALPTSTLLQSFLPSDATADLNFTSLIPAFTRLGLSVLQLEQPDDAGSFTMRMRARNGKVYKLRIDVEPTT
jgi:hypothetical protein